MRLTDWKEHAKKKLKTQYGNHTSPKTYSSMKFVAKSNGVTSTRASGFTDRDNDGRIFMLLERLQKENDQLKEEVVVLTKKHVTLKEESDLLLEIMADERNENTRLEKEILQMEQFSADVQLRRKMEDETVFLISENEKLQIENKKLKEIIGALLKMLQEQ